MKNHASILSAFVFTSILALNAHQALAYDVSGNLNLTNSNASEEIVNSFSNNAEDNGITLGGGGTPTLSFAEYNQSINIENNTATRTAEQENTLLDKGNGIYVNGSANIETGEKVLSVQNNEGAGVYVTNAAEAGQTNRLNFNASDSSHYFRENIAGIVVGDSESSANKGNAEMYVSFDEDGTIFATHNNSNGIHIAKNAYMNIENANLEVFWNGYEEAEDRDSPDTKIGDANGILVEGSLDIKGQSIPSPGGDGTMLNLSHNSSSGMEIRNADQSGQTNRVTITDMDIDLSFNEKYGILVGSNASNEQGSARLDITSTTGKNWFSNHGAHSAYYPLNTEGDELIFAQNGAEVNITNMNFSGWSYNTAAIGVDEASLTMKGNNSILASKGQILSNNKGTVVIDGMNIGGFDMGGDRVSVVEVGDGKGIETLGGSTTIRGNGNTLAMKSDYNGGMAIYVSSKDGQRGNFELKDMKSHLQGIKVVDSDMSVVTTNRDYFLHVVAPADNFALNIEAVESDAKIKIDNTVVSNYGALAALKGTAGDSSNRHTADLSITDSELNFFGNTVDETVFKTQDANINLTNAHMVVGQNFWNGENYWSLIETPQLSANPNLTLIDNTSTSTFNAANSKLIGSVNDNGNLTATLKNSTWHMINEANPVSTIDTLKITDSSIYFRPLVENADHNHHTLTIKNAFISDNTDIFMNVNLDEKNIGDKIIFANGAKMDGTANLHITNTAPLGSNGAFIRGDGIKVVDAQGSAITGANAFDLDGKKIDTGAYVQELFYQNMGTNDESWYLRTVTEEDGGGNKSTNGSFSNGKTALKTDLANSVTGMPVVALSVIKTINSELRNRLGELRSNNPHSKDGLWARGYYKSLEVDENIKNEMDIYGFEAGYDHLIVRNARNRTYMGIMAGYAQLDNLKITQVNDHNGKGDGFVPSVGAYLTWVNKNGWYTDAVVRGFLTQMDITNYSAQGQAITHDADRMAVAGSFELGRRSSVYQKGRSGFILEPKAQIAYTFMPSKDEKTNLGQKINYDATNSLVTRGAIMAAYRHLMRNGMVFEPYVQVGVAYEWLGKTDVEFDDVKFTSDVGGATFEGAIGLNARLSRGWHLYGDVNLEQGSVYKSWGGHLGLRYNF